MIQDQEKKNSCDILRFASASSCRRTSQKSKVWFYLLFDEKYQSLPAGIDPMWQKRIVAVDEWPDRNASTISCYGFPCRRIRGVARWTSPQFSTAIDSHTRTQHTVRSCQLSHSLTHTLQEMSQLDTVINKVTNQELYSFNIHYSNL